MALAPYIRWAVEFTFQDNNGNTATTGVSFPGTLDYPDVASEAADLGARLAAVSDAVLIQYTITGGAREAGTVDPPATSEVERKLVIGLNTAARSGAVKLEIPSPKFGLEIPGTDTVDQANTDVAALMNFLVQGSLGAGNGIVTYYGADIVSAQAPYVRHRSRTARK